MGDDETYVDSVVERTVLSDGDECRLVARRGVDGRDLVHTSGETVGDINSKDAVDSLVVQTLEEHEGRWVRDLGGSDIVDLLKRPGQRRVHPDRRSRSPWQSRWGPSTAKIVGRCYCQTRLWRTWQ